MNPRDSREFTDGESSPDWQNLHAATTMKTMMDLLISLRRADAAADAAGRNRQLSPGEKLVARRHTDLVREVIPPEVLTHYDHLKATATDLRESPELLAMAVLLTTYRSLSPAKRRKLLKHFAVTPGMNSSRNHSARCSPIRAGGVAASNLPPPVRAYGLAGPVWR